MVARQSKSALLYLEVRHALRSGNYVPGQRIDPATLAEEFHASATPVRFALYRLVGEGLIADHGRNGLDVPLPTEVMLRDQYDWMRRLLQMACDVSFGLPRPAAGEEADAPDGDHLACATWHLFDAIARATDHRSLHHAVEQANDRLAPVRWIGLGLVDDAADELSALIRHWQQGDEQALRSGLDAYHERRVILVGRLFGADGTPVRRTTDLPMIVSPAEFRRFVLERCWGEYVLFQAEATAAPAITITRDPSGGVACVCSLEHAPRFVTSDISLATHRELYRKQVDWDYIAHCLLYPHMVSQRTGLAGIRELLPGCLIRVTGMAWDSEPVWSPWDFVGAPARTRDSAEAAARVRHCVRMATKAWAGIEGRVLLELSGGLDSSILATCLRDAGADVWCSTLVTPVPGADERQYANLMADSLGVPLRVEELDFALARFDAPPPAWSVGPRINVLQQALNEAMAAVGASEDVASHFSGGGGDTVFCYLGNAAPAADAFRERGFSAGIHVVRDLSRLHQCTFWKAARLTLDKLARAPRAMQSPDSTLLHPRVAARPHDAHPWFDEPPETLPGDLQRIRLLAATHLYRHAMWRGPLRELRMPLLSQPVVEACLRAPTWMWVADGRNRSVARAAFAHDLPRPIRQRRSKGDFAQYLGAVWRRRQHDMQQFLLEGELQAEGLLDADALREFCARPELPRDESFNRIFELCTIENWLRHQR